MNQNSNIQKFYDDRADGYIDMVQGMDYGLPDWVRSHIRHSQATRILDLGCGAGNIGLVIKEELPNSRLWGVDLSYGMVAEADKTKLYEAVYQFDLSQGLPVEILNEEFDLVIGFGFLEFLDIPSDLLSLASSLLSTNGQIWWSIESTTDNSAPSGEVRPELGFAMYHYDKDQLIQLIEQSNLELMTSGQIKSYKRSYDQYFVPWWMVQCQKKTI